MIKYSKQLNELLQDIEVSDSEYEKAVARYNSVANYIADNYSEYEPELFLQGSFKLGTAIKPLTEDGAYDIDIVCCLNKLNKSQITQKQLKRIVGQVVKAYASANGMKEEPHDGKRCWTLQYVDEHNFHFDILPSIKNDTRSNVIAFTDKRNENYNVISEEWEISNPKDYYKWFFDISKHSQFKKQIALMEKRAIEKVPDYKVKTPLQRAVQLFKRHAEVMFANDIEHKPSSIIITTLAAKAYDSCGDTIDSFEDLLTLVSKKMILFLDNEYGKNCVKNPVNQKENLSEKWMKNKTYYQAFIKWQDKLKNDFCFDTYETRTFAYRNLNESLKGIKNNLHDEINLLDLSHHKKPKWPMVGKQDVHIVAKCMPKSVNAFIPFNSGAPLRKDGELKFEIITDNIYAYDIYWQITNTGTEASDAGMLRGGFYDSDIYEGKRVRIESTQFKGAHFVEAYIVKDGICYGKSEPFKVVIK